MHEYSPKRVERVEHKVPITTQRKKVPFYGETSYNAEFQPYQI